MILKKGLKRLLPFLRIGFSLFLIIFLLNRFDFTLIYQNIKKTRIEFLALAVLLNFIGDFLSSLQWKFVLAIHRIKTGMKKLFSLYLIGAFFNNFLPTSIGGDVYKIHRLSKNNVSINHAITSVLMTRVMGLWSLLLIATVVLFSPINLALTGADIKFILAILWVIVLVTLFLPKFLSRFKFLRELHSVLDHYRQGKRLFLRSFITSIIAQILGIFFCWAVAGSLSLKLTFTQIAYFSSLTIIISALPVTINGLGIREGIYVWLFNKAGIGGETALSFSFLIVILIAFRSIIGGILYASKRDRN